MLAGPSIMFEFFLAILALSPGRFDQLVMGSRKGPLDALGIAHVVGMINDLILTVMSVQGATWEEQKRVHIPTTLGFRAVVEVVKVIITIWLVVQCQLLVPATYKQASLPHMYWLGPAWIVVGLQICDTSCRLVLVLLLTGPKSRSTRSLDEQALLLGPFRMVFGILGRIAGTGGQEKLVVQLLSDYMHGFDWTLGDLYQGSILLQASQGTMRRTKTPRRIEELGLRSHWGEEEDRQLAGSCGGAMLDLPPASDKASIQDALHHLGFAVASYGWAVDIMFPRRGRGCCKNATKCWTRFSQASSMDEKIHAAGNAECATELLAEWPGHRDSQLVFYSPHGGVNVPRFCIFADKSEKNVVIAVRGTLSLGDAFTDMYAKPELLEPSLITGDGEGPHYVHLGMWEAAQFILRTIKRHDILSELKVLASWQEDTLIDGSEWAIAQGLSLGREFQDALLGSELPDCTGYGLVVTGHSLGGGVATYLKAMLSRHCPEVRCFVYGAPPVFSTSMARHHSRNMTYVVCGDDLVGRLGLRNMEFMRDRMVALLERCTFSKVRVIMTGLLHSLFGWNGIHQLILQTFEQPVTEEAVHVLGSDVQRQLHMACVHAGQPLYLRITPSPTACCGWYATGSPKFGAFLAETQDLQEILMNPDSFLHHMPERYRTSLEGALCALSPAGTEAEGNRRDLELVEMASQV